jgi:hypothetical protein
VGAASESEEKSAVSEYPSSIASKWSRSSLILGEIPWWIASENDCGRMATGLEIARSNGRSAVVPKIGRALTGSLRGSTTSRKKNEVPAAERIRRRSIIERGKWKVLGYADEAGEVNNNGAPVDAGQINLKISKPGSSVTSNWQDSTESIIKVLISPRKMTTKTVDPAFGCWSTSMESNKFSNAESDLRRSATPCFSLKRGSEMTSNLILRFG